ncbi:MULTISPECIES: YaaL family protein [unclassified Oceanobacillus]|uniref:YaaL family protein n=1 Tax=unclassified Oceanobacillus TaxID=2630292 RepID=UPI0012EB3F5A|nr:YaaL family protein [Oceanobacillus sp. AG]
MARKLKKKHIDTELLDSIFALEREWKQIRELGMRSIDRTLESIAAEQVAQAKYLYLLREARRRNVNALYVQDKK